MNLPASRAGDNTRCLAIDSFDKLHSFALDIGIDSYSAQLGPGSSEASVIQDLHDSLTVSRIAFDAPLYLRAKSLPGNLILGICQSASHASINGLTVKSRHCFVIMPGAEIDLFTRNPATLGLVSIPVSVLETKTDSLPRRLCRAMGGQQAYVSKSLAESSHVVSWFESWETTAADQSRTAHLKVVPLISGSVYLTLNTVIQNLQNRPKHLVTDSEWVGSGVKRLIDYFHDNPEVWISIDDACRLAEMGRRNLYYQFNKCTGLSPQKYFSRIRLSYLRQELTACKSSITELALKYNFHHLGDFSATYRAVYGELPSDTRKSAENSSRRHSREQLNWRTA